MINRILVWAIVIALAVITTGCSGGSMPDGSKTYDSLEKVPASAWDNLATKKIFFGHQSVGYNILDGVDIFLKEHQSVRLNIVQSTDKADLKQGTLEHSTVGENGKPESKIDAFAEILNNGIASKAHAAALKFCYLDFNRSTDTQKIFEKYKTTIENIKKAFPSLKIIHMTVPLLTMQTGPRAWVKKIIGRPIGGVDDNIKRFEYNQLLINEYAGKEPIFDISRIESTYPDGSREKFVKKGTTYYAMVPAYTNDGGHLNETGKKIVAEQFLLFLINNV